MAENNDNILTMLITQNEKVTDPGEDSPTASVIIELFPDIAPNHVKQIKTLVSEGFYDGINNQYTVFGRVKEGMEFIDKIVRGEPPEFPDKIVSIRLSENN